MTHSTFILRVRKTGVVYLCETSIPNYKLTKSAAEVSTFPHSLLTKWQELASAN